MNPANTQNPTPATGAKRTSIARKISFGFAAVGVTTTIAAASVSYFTAKNALEEAAYAKMLTTRSVLKKNIAEYFTSLRHALATAAESPIMPAAVKDFRAGRASLKRDLEAGGATLDAATMGEVRTKLREYYTNILIKNLQQVRGSDPGSVESYIPGTDETELLQYTYAVANPASVGSKNEGTSAAEIAAYSAIPPKLRAALATTSYVKAHDKYHAEFTGFLKRFGLGGLLVSDANGTILYNTLKTLELGSNTKFGPDKDSGMARAINAALLLPAGESVVTDMAPYAKSFDAPTMFAATPIYEDGKVVGAIAVKVPTKDIEDVITFGGQQDKLGLGATGEAFLFGEDLVARTNSRFVDRLPASSKRKLLSADGKTIKDTSENAMVTNSEMTRGAIAGQSGHLVRPDYRGVPVLASYEPLSIPGLNWGIEVKQDKAEADAAATKLLYVTLGSGFALVLASLGVGSVFARRLSNPIIALDKTMVKVAGGDTAARSPVISNDETATLAETFNHMLVERNAVQERLAKENDRLQANIQDLLLVVADASDGNMNVRAKVSEGALGNVADALNLMFENVGDLISNAKVASGRVSASAGMIAQVAADVHTGAERQAAQIGHTTVGINDLNGQSQSVINACAAANDHAANTRAAAEQGATAMRELLTGMEKIRESVQANAKKIKRLGDRSMEIAGMVKVIGDISAQTDMLAFNASIEASRAGEQGRGFSVVAEQVRALAEKTKALTDQIDKLVRDTQAETAEAVNQMEAQTQIVEGGARSAETAGGYLANIVTASGQSAEAVALISQAANIQATRTAEMLVAIGDIGRIVNETQEQVSSTRSTSSDLTLLSSELDRQLSQFAVGKN